MILTITVQIIERLIVTSKNGLALIVVLPFMLRSIRTLSCRKLFLNRRYSTNVWRLPMLYTFSSRLRDARRSLLLKKATLTLYRPNF